MKKVIFRMLVLLCVVGNATAQVEPQWKLSFESKAKWITLTSTGTVVVATNSALIGIDQACVVEPLGLTTCACGIRTDDHRHGVGAFAGDGIGSGGQRQPGGTGEIDGGFASGRGIVCEGGGPAGTIA